MPTTTITSNNPRAEALARLTDNQRAAFDAYTRNRSLNTARRLQHAIQALAEFGGTRAPCAIEIVPWRKNTSAFAERWFHASTALNPLDGPQRQLPERAGGRRLFRRTA